MNQVHAAEAERGGRLEGAEQFPPGPVLGDHLLGRAVGGGVEEVEEAAGPHSAEGAGGAGVGVVPLGRGEVVAHDLVVLEHALEVPGDVLRPPFGADVGVQMAVDEVADERRRRLRSVELAVHAAPLLDGGQAVLPRTVAEHDHRRLEPGRRLEPSSSASRASRVSSR